MKEVGIFVISMISFLFVIMLAAIGVKDSKKEITKIITDAITGCQYITYVKGGITPCLNKNGQHICEVTEKS